MKKLFLLSFAFLLFQSCYYDNAEELYANLQPDSCNTVDVSYAEFIQPLSDAQCAFSGCHIGASPAAGLDLSSYAGLKQIADDGKFVDRINAVNGLPLMPQGGPKLPSCDISKITAWVQAGAPNN
jgi:hypothetical protein